MEAEGGAQLFTTLALMFGGALLAGCAPFFMHVRESHLQTVAALGAGLLIGSALAVIVPEGFHAFAHAAVHTHGEPHAGSHAHDHAHDHDHGEHSSRSAHSAHASAAAASHGHAHEEGGPPEGLAGLVLVGGFLAMMLLDHLQHAAGGSCGHPGHSHGHVHSHSHSHGGEGSDKANDKGKGGGKGASDGGNAVSAAASAAAGTAAAAVGKLGQEGGGGKAAAEAPDCTGKAKAGPAAADPSNAITGLLIHCCADGLAMGAAFLSGNARLTVIIAAAMVLHKVPMAFGLGTYLLACHWGWQRAQRTLALFAAAAPAATLATYSLLGSLSFLSSPTAVALCVIFSGGTFLYAATMHILPEVLGSSGRGRLGGGQLAAVVAGALLPVALSWGHHH
ncbi:hypothetical protein ABPG75_004261 [Micractinium tetrahymenae]